MCASSFKIKNDVSIVLCGAAGQGIQTVEHLLTRVLKTVGYNVFATKEYMSRVRGGTNSTEIRLSSKRVSAYVDRIDLFIPLSKGAIPRQKKRISKETVIVGEKEFIEGKIDPKESQIIEIPFSEIALNVGGKIYSNIVAAGVITGLFDVESEIIENYLKSRFGEKGEAIVNNNLEASRKGYEIANDLIKSKRLAFEIQKDQKVKSELLFNGTESIAMGAIAGGCNFVCSYPMSPSTGVLTFLANNGKEFDILVEQAEDEIAAINAVLGAWYAGGRGLVTTSGGGFALMGEGLSLAGMTETPVVIHLAQRPGPATGLPTRTEQGDLELALYSGHGEFPRILLAPGSNEEGFNLAQKAFNLADKYQVPVIILTDQYFVDAYYNIPSLGISKITIEKHITKTAKNYKRYKLTETGISPRGIPSYGEGIIAVDSDEHDEEGHITEDLDSVRIKMVEKRLKKLEEIKKAVIPPELIGNQDYKILIIGWGSTYHVIKEALKKLKKDDVAFLHFKQIYPLHSKTATYLKKAETTIIIENNSTSQFGKVIKLYTGIELDSKILKYNGLPFSVEEVLENLKKLVS